MRDVGLLDEYILGHIDVEDAYLRSLYRETHVKLLYPRMASGHLQGCLLKMLVTMIRPKSVLEIGTYSGYSALCIAKGLPDGAFLHTFEINDEIEPFTRKWIEGSDCADKVFFHIGDALQLIPAMDLTFDMVFIDADKRKYLDYYQMAMDKLQIGGYILADNTLWDGHVVDDNYDHDPQTLGIRRFNDFVANDDRVEKVMLPIRDGLTIIRKVSEKCD